MKVALVQVPYHLGRENVGMGKGVAVLAEMLAGEGVEPVRVERSGEALNEIAASMSVIHAVADRVRELVARGAFPLVLAGNCNSSLGTVAGLDTSGDFGVVWFDAHADFNTPDTTEGAFFDGMALAMLTGSGWRALRQSVTGLRPVPEESVVLVGARDLDAGERARLEGSSVALADPSSLERALAALSERVDHVYLHVDLDVLDPSVARANPYAVEGGLSLGELEGAIQAVGQRFAIRAAALTAYDPDCDPNAAIPPAARSIFKYIVEAAGRTEAAA